MAGPVLSPTGPRSSGRPTSSTWHPANQVREPPLGTAWLGTPLVRVLGRDHRQVKRRFEPLHLAPAQVTFRALYRFPPFLAFSPSGAAAYRTETNEVAIYRVADGTALPRIPSPACPGCARVLVGGQGWKRLGRTPVHERRRQWAVIRVPNMIHVAERDAEGRHQWKVPVSGGGRAATPPDQPPARWQDTGRTAGQPAGGVVVGCFRDPKARQERARHSVPWHPGSRGRPVERDGRRPHVHYPGSSLDPGMAGGGTP